MSNKDYTKFSNNQIKPNAVENQNGVVNVEEKVDEPIVDRMKMGWVENCVKLNVRLEPEIDAEILCVINVGDEVLVDEMNSTDDFYRVCLANGNEGFCMKKYIEID